MYWNKTIFESFWEHKERVFKTQEGVVQIPVMCVWHKNFVIEHLVIEQLRFLPPIIMVKIGCVENQLGPVQMSHLCQAELDSNNLKARLNHGRNTTVIQTSCQSHTKIKIYWSHACVLLVTPWSWEFTMPSKYTE